jgi:carboxyl-terminal processing protease
LKKILIVALLFPVFLFSQSDNTPCETLSRLATMIQDNHYKPKPIDDSLSVFVFKTFIDRLDEDHRLFIDSEVQALKKHQYKIDDYIKEKNCAFLHEFYVSYTKTVSRYSAMITALRAAPFAMSSPEKIVFSKKTFPFSKNEAELKHIYQKRVLFHILQDISELSKNKDSITQHFGTLFPVYKNKIFDKYQCKADSYQMTETEFNGLFYNTFCNYFDPHSEYFTDTEKSSFYSGVSSDNLTFGMYITLSDKDEMTISDILPGSSAYFTGKMDKGDQLLKIKHDTETLEIECASMKKIDEIITSKEYKTADFTFRKKSGEIYTVTLVKKIMKDYQNNVFSFKIKKGDATFGYIRIPSFYSTFENGKSNVSNDVAKEVYKLQESAIDGIIIDLQNNGGGSLEEAIRLSGMFIDIGPVAVMNDHQNKKEIIKDQARGLLYNGPLAILINGFSASASEFFTNAMQDYKRAIVLGNHSLGKATMQQIFPLTDKNDEFLKLTLEKFYRITGKSNQYIGIQPDIEVPSLFDHQYPREDKNETALKNDLIDITLKYPIWQSIDYTPAITKAQERIKNSTDALGIQKINVKIDALYDNDLPPVVLQLDTVFAEVNQMNSLWKEIHDAKEKQYPLELSMNTLDLDAQKYDEFLKSCNSERMKDIRQNYTLIEALNTLSDLKTKP